MKSTVPISDIIPLVPWIQQYHDFRMQFDQLLQRSGKTPTEIHLDKFGAEASPGVWEGSGYRVLVGIRSVSIEVLEGSSVREALDAFEHYRETLFGPNSEPPVS
jgi:hypothetical protein